MHLKERCAGAVSSRFKDVLGGTPLAEDLALGPTTFFTNGRYCSMSSASLGVPGRIFWYCEN